MNPANVGETPHLKSRRICELVVAEVKPCSMRHMFEKKPREISKF